MPTDIADAGIFGASFGPWSYVKLFLNGQVAQGLGDLTVALTALGRALLLVWFLHRQRIFLRVEGSAQFLLAKAIEHVHPDALAALLACFRNCSGETPSVRLK